MFWTTNDFRRIVTFKIRNKQVYMKKNINIQHQGGGLGIRGTNSRKKHVSVELPVLDRSYTNKEQTYPTQKYKT